MTNVPGAGFVALLAAIGLLLALPPLAGVSLLVSRATRRHLAWTLLGVHAAAAALGTAALLITFGVGGFQDAPLGATVGLLGFALAAVVGGLFVAAVAEGVPIAAGAALTVLVGGASRERGLWYGTAGYALGGVGGTVAGLTLTGTVEGAAVGALSAAPLAFAAPVLEAAFSSVRAAPREGHAR